MTRVGFDTFVIYTTEVGGPMTVCWSSREVYEEARSTGRLTLWTRPGEQETVEVKMVALATVEDLRDFVLDPVKP